VPDPHLTVILNDGRNKGHKVSVLVVFLELNGRCSTEMERLSGSVGNQQGGS
jgi:hypothetical protein